MNISVHPQTGCLADVLRGFGCGQHHNGNTRKGWIFLDFSQDFSSSHVRHIQVQKNHAGAWGTGSIGKWASVVQIIKEFVAVMHKSQFLSHRDLTPCLFHYFTVITIIVNQQDSVNGRSHHKIFEFDLIRIEKARCATMMVNGKEHRHCIGQNLPKLAWVEKKVALSRGLVCASYRDA